MVGVLTVLVIAFASALIPLINLEAYLGVRGALDAEIGVWALGFVAGLGQMLGKVIWYHLGANSLSWAWIKKKIDQPKRQARLRSWRARTQDRPVIAGGLVFVSALTGLPPFAIFAVIAGQLKMNLMLFFVIGLLGRWLRFSAILGGVVWLKELSLS